MLRGGIGSHHTVSCWLCIPLCRVEGSRTQGTGWACSCFPGLPAKKCSLHLGERDVDLLYLGFVFLWNWRHPMCSLEEIWCCKWYLYGQWAGTWLAGSKQPLKEPFCKTRLWWLDILPISHSPSESAKPASDQRMCVVPLKMFYPWGWEDWGWFCWSYVELPFWGGSREMEQMKNHPQIWILLGLKLSCPKLLCCCTWGQSQHTALQSLHYSYRWHIVPFGTLVAGSRAKSSVMFPQQGHVSAIPILPPLGDNVLMQLSCFSPHLQAPELWTFGKCKCCQTWRGAKTRHSCSREGRVCLQMKGIRLQVLHCFMATLWAVRKTMGWAARDGCCWAGTCHPSPLI